MSYFDNSSIQQSHPEIQRRINTEDPENASAAIADGARVSEHIDHFLSSSDRNGRQRRAGFAKIAKRPSMDYAILHILVHGRKPRCVPLASSSPASQPEYTRYYAARNKKESDTKTNIGIASSGKLRSYAFCPNARIESLI